MAIYTMEGVYSMHGLGVIPQDALYRPLTTSTLAPTASAPPMAVVAPTQGFLDQWGIPIAAGAGAFLIGLAIAKFATSRKKRR